MSIPCPCIPSAAGSACPAELCPYIWTCLIPHWVGNQLMDALWMGTGYWRAQKATPHPCFPEGCHVNLRMNLAPRRWSNYTAFSELMTKSAQLWYIDLFYACFWQRHACMLIPHLLCRLEWACLLQCCSAPAELTLQKHFSQVLYLPRQLSSTNLKKGIS